MPCEERQAEKLATEPEPGFTSHGHGCNTPTDTCAIWRRNPGTGANVTATRRDPRTSRGSPRQISSSRDEDNSASRCAKKTRRFPDNRSRDNKYSSKTNTTGESRWLDRAGSSSPSDSAVIHTTSGSRVSDRHVRRGPIAPSRSEIRRSPAGSCRHITGVSGIGSSIGQQVRCSHCWHHPGACRSTWLRENPYRRPVAVPAVHCHPDRFAARDPSRRWRKK